MEPIGLKRTVRYSSGHVLLVPLLIMLSHVFLGCMSPLDQIAVLGTNYCTVLCAKNQLYNQLYLVQP